LTAPALERENHPRNNSSLPESAIKAPASNSFQPVAWCARGLYAKLDSKISLEVDRLTGSTREQLIEYLAESPVRLKTLEGDVHNAQLENRSLRELLRLPRIEKYGPGSEKLSEEQLALLELEPEVSQAEVQAESERAQLKLPFRKAPQPAKHPGRQELPAHLPRVEKIIACTPNSASAPSAENTRI
jgi:hypothetical protein